MLLRTRSSLPLVLLPLLAPACSDPERDPCQHDVCRIDHLPCVERTAAAVACQLGLDDVTIPEVRLATTTELAAEIEATSEPASEDHVRDVVDYYRGEALLGLMPDDYQYGDDRTAFLEWAVAYYSSDTGGVVIITDNLGSDRENNYVVLVHELVHAYQDATRDLSGLVDEHGSTFDRFLGLRAVIEGEANHHDTIAAVQLAGNEPEDVLWHIYYADYQEWAFEQAALSPQPSLDVFAYFPYAFGGQLISDAWLEDGLDEIDRVFATPPDSVRQVMAGYAAWPDMNTNGDAQLEPHAAPVLPERYEYLGGGHQSVWLINAMIQRTAGGSWTWAPTLESVSADYLSIFRDGDSEALVAFWRIQTSTPDEMADVLTSPMSLWALDAGTHSISFVEGGLLLVATSGPLAADVLAEVEGWQTTDDVLEAGDGEYSLHRPGPHGAPLGPCQHARHRLR